MHSAQLDGGPSPVGSSPVGSSQSSELGDYSVDSGYSIRELNKDMADLIKLIRREQRSQDLPSLILSHLKRVHSNFSGDENLSELLKGYFHAEGIIEYFESLKDESKNAYIKQGMSQKFCHTLFLVLEDQINNPGNPNETNLKNLSDCINEEKPYTKPSTQPVLGSFNTAAATATTKLSL